MVFAFRAVEAIERGKGEAEPTGAMRAVIGGEVPVGVIGGRPLRGGPPVGVTASVTSPEPTAAELRANLQRTMTRQAGVLRTADSLTSAYAAAVSMERGLQNRADAADRAVLEVRNLLAVSAAMTGAALARQESRGAHTRGDFPERDDVRFAVRLVIGGPTGQAGAP
jgi:L-aspartate oxidase